MLARLSASCTTLVLLLALFAQQEAFPSSSAAKAPSTLRETGLYSDFETLQVDARHLAFSPQYPLWTDGATKRRWISLPPGTAIDGSNPEAWTFPVGTRLWKEFSFGDQRIETRYIERTADGQWLYAAYAWSQDGSEVHLTSTRGKRGAYALGGGRSHSIPAVSDCKACHQGGRGEVLGFSALQLSQARDPGALHAELEEAVDIEYLIKRGLLINYPSSLRATSPQIIASSSNERASLGYLHGNCRHCHNEKGPLKNLGLFLANPVAAAFPPAVESTVGQPIKNAAPGQNPDAVLRVHPQDPDRSGLMQRMASRYPALQMPPLGTELVDSKAVELLRRWIAETQEGRIEAHQVKGE